MGRRVVSGPDQSGGGPPQSKTLEHFQQSCSARRYEPGASGALGCAGGHRHGWGKLKAWVGRRRRAADCAPYHAPVTGRGFGGLWLSGSGRRQMEISTICKQFEPPCVGGCGGGDKFLSIPFYTPPALG